MHAQVQLRVKLAWPYLRDTGHARSLPAARHVLLDGSGSYTGGARLSVFPSFCTLEKNNSCSAALRGALHA